MSKAPQATELAEFQRAASKLRPIEREVLFLSAREGLSYDQIAARLDIASEEARGLLADALCGLDRELERRGRPWWRFW